MTGRHPTPLDLRGIWQREDGQDLAEYAILVGLIALAVVGAVTLFGGQLVTLYGTIVATLPFVN